MTDVQLNRHSTAAGQRGLSGCTLKMIAVVTMLIDHIAATVLWRLLEQHPAWGPVTAENYHGWKLLYDLMRGIGRMAFPIYCFLLVEGFYHTKNLAKYAFRLFLFLSLSEVPFDMALNSSFFDMSYNNVFFTLLMGLFTIWTADLVRTRVSPDKPVIRYLLLTVIVTAGCALAAVFHTDYGAAGILAIFMMYLMYQDRMAGFAVMVVVLGLFSSPLEFAALLMLVPMYFYNGTRGRQHKYLFYAFYPVHLLILSLICWWMGLEI